MMHYFPTLPFLATRPRLWLLALLLLAAPLARAQAPAWQTLASPSFGTDRSSVYATAPDASGNIYVAGGFYGTLTLGSTTLTSAGLRDIYLAKWSPATGTFLWAQQAGSTGDEYVNGLAVSGISVYLTGVFGSSQLVLGGTTLTNVNPLASGINFDGYVAKFADNGAGRSFAWARSFGGTGTDYGNGIGLNGNVVYVSGIFNSPTLDFGAATLTNAGPATPATTDVYLAKFIDAGAASTFGWAERLGGPGGEFCSGLASSNGSLYLMGSFGSPTLTLGTTTLTNASNTTASNGTEDVFVVRLTDLGTGPVYNWAQRGGGPNPDQALRIAVQAGSVYIAGRITGTAAPGGTTTFGTTVLPIAGPTDAFVAKLSDTPTAGSFVWAQALGGPSSDYAYALAVRGSSVYVGGVYQGTATFGPSTVTSQGNTDVFVTRLVDAGPTAQVAWGQTGGGTGAEDAFSIVLVGNRVYVGGDLTPSATFGGMVVPAPTGVGIVAFLASITDAVGLPTATTGPRELAGTGLFPNPAHGTATVQLPAVPGAATATLTLLDALGRPVRTATVALPAAGQRHELDLVGLPAGLYALRIAAGGASATHRLTVE